MIIRESWLLVDQVEDWSRVRSPSRALRRLKQGHRQNIIRREVPKKEAISIDGGQTFIMHPETAKAFRQAVEEKFKPAPADGWGVSLRRPAFFNVSIA